MSLLPCSMYGSAHVQMTYLDLSGLTTGTPKSRRLSKDFVTRHRSNCHSCERLMMFFRQGLHLFAKKKTGLEFQGRSHNISVGFCRL